MENNNGHHGISDKATAAGVLIALGIVFGDIGTSPLYVMQAIIDKAVITPDIILGGVSCVFWTLTMQTTLKYVVMILRADNKGEGGTLTLFALVRRHAKWLTIPTMIGGAALLADGIITPPMSVSSAVEGLLKIYPDIQTLPIVLVILTGLFLLQVLGTNVVGKAFGPIMLTWFTMLGILGSAYVFHNLSVLKAINPYYGYKLLTETPGGFWLLGAVFLCTTGAEALYSDLGHCGRANIRFSWVYVKACLLLNYFGQAAWLLEHTGQTLDGRKPFYEIMPQWFLLPGIAIATVAAIIASQALISGSFTLVSEAIRLNFWPKIRLKYPSNQKGQLYVPSINFLLWAGCIGIMLFFKNSSNMEAAYGLAITLTMLVDTLLMSYFLYSHRYNMWWVVAFFLVFFAIESSFMVANLSKFAHGGYVSLLVCAAIAGVMFIWLKANQIKARLIEYVKLEKYHEALKALSIDVDIPKYATHLVFMSNASRVSDIESKIMYSILEKRPKRADIYWFVHVDTTDEPFTMKYKVDIIEPDDIIKVTFKLGFRVEQRINLYLRHVIENMVKNKEVDISSRYESLNKQNVIGDFRFVVLERFLSFENDLPFFEKIIMEAYFFIKNFTTTEDKWFGLDSSAVKIEKVPLIIRPAENMKLERTY